MGSGTRAHSRSRQLLSDEQPPNSCTVIIGFIALLLFAALGVAGAFVYICHEPPEFRLDEVSISGLDSAPGGSFPEPQFSISVGVRRRQPSRCSLTACYRNGSVEVIYERAVVAEALLADLQLDVNASPALRASMVGARGQLAAAALRRLADELGRGAAAVEVEVKYRRLLGEVKVPCHAQLSPSGRAGAYRSLVGTACV